MHRRASVLRTAQGIFASLPAVALLPAVLHGVEKRATVVAVDVYGCFKLLTIIVRQLSVHGESENGRTSSRRRDSDVMPSECGDVVRNTIIPASCIQCVQYLASSVQRPAS